MRNRFAAVAWAAVLALTGTASLTGCGSKATASESGTITLTNVSYDPTRELYVSYNEAFKKYYKETKGIDVEIKAATPSILGLFDINVFSGLSMYLPCDGSANLDNFYKTLAWNAATGLVE